MKKIDSLVAGMITSLTFALIGIVAADIFWENDKFLLIIFLVLLVMYPLYLLVIICHEFGHYIFGKLSGYQFSAFRVLNKVLIKKKEKYQIKKMGLVGTAGQCIMIPPKDKEVGIVLYNLGGILVNLILAVISFLIYIRVSNDYLKLLIFIFMVLNIYTFLINAIPFKLLVNNDMRNIIIYSKDKEAYNNFLNMLYLQDMITSGMRLKDIGKEYIFRPKKIVDVGDVDKQHMYCNQLMDDHKFKKAIREIKRIINNKDINMIYKADLINDLIYCYIILDMDLDEIDKLRSKDILNLFRQMNDNPSILRTEYAYELKVNNDASAAEKILKKFNKIGKSFPYESLYLCDKELIDLINDKKK